MTVKECANHQLKAEFPLTFDEKQPVSVRLAEIKRAEELLSRDNRTDPVGIAEMKRQLEALWETLTKKLSMIELHCKNGKCGRTFAVELGSLFENKGWVDCPHCGKSNVYDLKKGKLLK